MHIPVLLREIIEYLDIKPDDIILDGTIGFGGHSSELIKNLSNKGLHIGLDTDTAAVEHCKRTYSSYKNSNIFQISYKDFPIALTKLNIGKVSKMLLDLGLSSYQLDNSGRGFSFLKDEPLDMRMDLTGNNLKTAAEIIKNYSKDDLKRVFKEYGELHNCEKFVDEIVYTRRNESIETTFQVVRLIKKGFYFRDNRKRYLKTCALVFQALRIEVNQELENIKSFLAHLHKYLAVGGRVAIITFHSLEDRIVKEFILKHHNKEHISKYLKEKTTKKKPGNGFLVRPINKRVIQASQEEIKLNPRAKSAKLRVFERIG